MKNAIDNDRESATSLNIAILPSEEITLRAIRMSERISSAQETHFTVNKKTLLPHITIYQAHFPDSNRSLLTQELVQLASRIQPFTVSLRGFSLNYDTFLFWECEKSSSLQQFHEETVKTVNSYRNGLILPHLAGVSGLTKEDHADIDKYGSLLIGDRYHPHITITRIKRSEDAKGAIALLPSDSTGDFIVNKFVLGYLSDHGTVTGVIDTYHLNK